MRAHGGTGLATQPMKSADEVLDQFCALLPVGLQQEVSRVVDVHLHVVQGPVVAENLLEIEVGVAPTP